MLREVCGSESDAYYFVDNDLVRVGEETRDFGNNTYLRNALDRTLAQQPAPAILWLVTDNQPSVGNQTDSDRDIAAFYERLRSDSVKRLYFFPLKLDFKGKLFKEDGHQLLAANYVGKRGLLVYALLLDESAGEEFERATSELQSRYEAIGAGQTRRILIKPLEQDTVTARVVPREKFRLENELLVAGDFNEGGPISGRFDIELTSKLGQMKISHADIDVKVPDKFRTGDFTESEIVPEFSPHNIKDFEPDNMQRIEVKLNAPGVHIRRNPVSWWNCITHNRGDVNGTVQIKIKVQGQNLDVTSNLATEFSTSRDIYNDASENVQSRIYNLDVLVKQMMPQRSVDIRPHIGKSQDGIIPVRLVVLYPKWPVVAMIAAILLLLVLLLLLWRLLGRPQLYRLTWDSGQYRACPDFRLWPLVGRRINLDDRAAATIKKSWSGIRVRAAGGYTVDQTRSRFVNPNGTDFSLNQTETGAGVNFYFSSTTAAFRSGSGGQNDEDSILGGVSYTAGGPDSDGAARGIASAPPIRKPTSGPRADNETKSAAAKTGDDSNYNLDDLFP